MSDWQPIETAPDDGNIIVFGGRYSEPTIVLADGEHWRLMRGKYRAIPTHWMPLPEPPQ